MEKLLNKNLVDLTTKLSNLTLVLNYLIQEEIITENESSIIKSKITSIDANTELIVILKKKDDEKLPMFLKILRVTGNNHLADKLDETVKLKILECGDNDNEPGISHSQSLEDSQLKRTNSGSIRNKYQKGDSVLTFNPDTASSSDSGPSIQNDLGVTTVNHKINHRNKSGQNKSILNEKWWPERKHLIKSFYERKLDGELMVQKLHSMLQESNTTVITQETIVVSGLGGIGKTTIAKSFAVHYESEYEHIIWIDCGEGSLINSFKSLARDLNLEDRLELNLIELARKSFAKLGELKCLLIYDNAECYVGNEGIRDVLPNTERNNNLHSIITSRNQEWGTATGYGKISTFCMNVFNNEESLQFMKNSLEANSNIKDTQISRLCQLLGHLPLALQISVATLNNHKITITRYIEQIQLSDNEELLNETLDDYERTINKTMQVSLDQIKKEINGHHAYNILMRFGYINPDDVELSFLQDIELNFLRTMEDSPKMKEDSFNIPFPDPFAVKSLPWVRKSVALLEKFSLVSVAKKMDKEYVSIHRLLQQVIRHNGKETEKNILRKILSCEGHIDYKLIPYIFAASHEDLKLEFAHIKAQLIDQMKLEDLLIERRFNEAANLALIIHSTFDALVSRNKYLISKYNYAVCLEKSGQSRNSLSMFQILVDELNSVIVNNSEWIQEIENYKGKCWTIDETEGIKFQLISLLSDSIPNRLLIKIYIGFNENISGDCIQCHAMWEMKFSNVTKLNKINQMLIILHFGLIILDSKECFTIRNEFVDEIGNFNNKKYNVDFLIWFKFSSKLAKVAFKLLSTNLQMTFDSKVLSNLFLVSRKFLFRIECTELRRNSPKCKLLCKDLHRLTCNVNVNELQTLRNIIYELYLIIRKKSDTKEDGEEPPSQIYSKYGYEFQPATVENGKFTLTSNVDYNFFPRFPNPELLTSLILEDVTIYMSYLLTSITKCCNLVEISIKKVKFWGVGGIQKIQLSNLKRFQLSVLKWDRDSKELNLNLIDWYTFFGGSDHCVWKSIKSLDYYNIAKSNRSIECRNGKDQTLTLSNINTSHLQLYPFQKLIVKYCTFHLGSIGNDNDGCYFCVKKFSQPNLVVTDNSIETLENMESCELRKLDKHNGEYCFKTEEIIINECLFLDKKCNKMMSINPFLMMYNNLKVLDIFNCKCLLVDLFGLDFIEVIKIKRVKVHCSRPTINTSDMVSQLTKRCKKLILNSITPVDKMGCPLKTIDFSFLNLDELEWIDYSRNGYFVMIDQFSSGLKKLRLSRVGLKCTKGIGTNSANEYRNSIDTNLSSLHTLIMEGWSSNALELDLRLLPHSLKEMKLNKINLTGLIPPHNTIHLSKLILQCYKKRDFYEPKLKALLCRVDNIVITVEKSVDVENIIISFPSNIKNVFAYTSRYERHSKVINDNSNSWKIKEITKSEFDEETKI